MARLQIRTFGGLQVLDERRLPVLLPARKAAVLVAYLALHPGRALPRARLAALLWGSSGETAARASLRQALLVVRRALRFSDDELVAGPGETIQLAVDVVSVDALAVEEATAVDDAGFDLDRAGALLEAIEGDFLEGQETREPGIDDWIALRRAQLRTRLAAAHARLVDAFRARSLLDPAITSALRLLALDPLREDVHRTLMEMYAAQRRWGAALQQFQLCRDVLARELGVRPAPSTLQLRDAIERQRLQVDSAAPPPAERATGVSPELRHVVLLAAEPATAATEADPEHAQALADAALAMAVDIVGRFSGTATRRPGGGLLGCFGVPVAHADDAERAARCALRLVGDLPGLRVGLAAGLALVTPEPSDPVGQRVGGEVAGLASRLLGAAAPGEVLATQPLWRRLGALAEGQACPDAALPSMLRGTSVHRITALRRGIAHGTAPVGRRSELAQFSALLDGCVHDGVGGVLHLRGEPGIGKTRLVEEFRAVAAARGFAVHQGVVLDFGSGIERDAVRALVLDLLGMDTATDGRAIEAGIAAAVAQGLASEDDEAALHAVLHQMPPQRLRSADDAMDPAARVHARRDALARLARSSAARQPRLLVLEDLHWADADTLGQAAALARVSASAPVLLVTTARSDGDPLDVAWREAAGAATVGTFDLGPLRPADAAALAAQMAEAEDSFTQRCVERCGGNPLFLEQLLQDEPTQAGSLPATIQTVVQARLDRLEVPEHEALRVASVLGQRFALAALGHLLGAGSAWDPQRARGLLRAEGDAGVFAHALVRDGAYASLPRARRRELHAMAARWYAGRDAVLRAEHLESAENAEAAQVWLEVSRAEAKAHRHERARAFAARGLTLEAAALVRFALATALAQALHDLGQSADAHAAWLRALADATDDAGRCQAWIGIAATLRLRDDIDGAMDALDRAQALAKSTRNDEARGRVHLMRGNLLFPRGDLEGCLHEHQACLALAQRAGAVELEAAALGGLGDAEYLRGRMVTAERRFTDCVALAQRLGLRRVEVANLPMAAWTRWFAGDAAGALEAVLQGVRHAQAIGHLRAEAIAHHIGCLARQALGEPDAALHHAQLALDLARRLQSPRFEAEALAFLGDLDAAQGNTDASRRQLDAAVALARSSGMTFMGPVFLALQARAASDDGARRRAALEEVETLLATNGLAHNHLLARRAAIDACLAAGDATAMRHHAQCLEVCTRGEPLPWSDFLVRRARILADQLEDRDVATPGGLAALADEGARLGLVVDARRLRDAAAGWART